MKKKLTKEILNTLIIGDEMADFNIAIEKVFKNEGGYNNVKGDNGGATNFGLSLRFLQGIYPDWTEKQVKELTKEAALQIYKQFFWNRTRYCEISNQRIANYVLDCAVNHGPAQANKFLQRAIMAVDTPPSIVKDDGILGNITLSKVNSAEIEKLALWCCLKAIRADFFRALVRKDKTQEKFLKGWLSRAYEKL